jgi:drug/metabolite transporter (DMT)-like permease
LECEEKDPSIFSFASVIVPFDKALASSGTHITRKQLSAILLNICLAIVVGVVLQHRMFSWGSSSSVRPLHLVSLFFLSTIRLDRSVRAQSLMQLLSSGGRSQ